MKLALRMRRMATSLGPRTGRLHPVRRPLSTASGTAKASCRGTAALDLLPSYLAGARAVPKYNAESQPDGLLNLSVAENRMLEDMLVPRVNAVASTEFPASGIYYQNTQGLDEVRNAMAAHFSAVLTPTHRYNFLPENLVVGAGCNAVLENLFFSIAEHGDGVLVPAPYYAAFEFDLSARIGLRLVPVQPAGVASGGALGLGW